MWSELSKILRATNLSAGICRQIFWKNVTLHFLSWPITLISLLKLLHSLTTWKKLMSFHFLKRMILLTKRTTTQLLYFQWALRFLKNWFIYSFFEFYTLFFWKGAQYPTRFIQLTSSLAKRVKSKRICGYNFGGFIKSISLYTKRSSDS